MPDTIMKGFLNLSCLGPELQKIVNDIQDGEVYFIRKDGEEKKFENAIIVERKIFLFLDALNGLTVHPADHFVGQLLTTKLTRYLLTQKNLDVKNMIKNLRSLADSLQFGKLMEESLRQALETHEEFQRNGEPPDAVELDDLNPDLTLKNPPKAPVDSTFELPDPKDGKK